MAKLRGLFLLNDDAARMIYGPAEMAAVCRHVDLLAPTQTPASVSGQNKLLAKVDVLFSGWGGPLLDDDLLESVPNLRAVFYGAGSLASIVTDAVWDRGIQITTAVAANAIPVAEYTLAAIIFSLKHFYRMSREVREAKNYSGVDRNTAPGCYGKTVGIISLGMIARKLLELLKPFDLNVIVYDPFLAPMEAAALGVTSVSLEELFLRSDVVTLHSPHLKETEGMITGQLLASMQAGATFINTARPGVVCQDELIEVAARRPDLQFILDVADPEPPLPDSPLYTLPNVTLTPHIAGSAGNECRRMGRYMVEELERYVAGKPLKWAVTSNSIRHTSHQRWWDLPAKNGMQARAASASLVPVS